MSKWARARRIRQGVQIVFFALFIYLMFATVQQRVAPALADLFFRLNPLSALGAMLAGRTWLPRLALALITIGLALLFGRVWCGWICPLGSLLEWVSFRKRRKKEPSFHPRLRTIKYFLFATILVLALLGNSTLLALDPIAILTRSTTTVVIPSLNYAITTIETTLYPLYFLQPVLDWLESWLRGPILPIKQPAFAQSILIGLVFAAILGLNALADRFWCRYLCPLGGLLGLLAKVSIFRPVIGTACNHCTRCALVCRPGAVEVSPETVSIAPSECIVCLDCLASCKKEDIRFQPVFRPAASREYDLTRREALGVMGVGLASLLLFRTDLRNRRQNPLLIRPPGVNDEDKFLSSCLRCTQCVKICPTTALQPAFDQAGLEGFWTPVLVPRVGYCDYGCTACGQVCPSGAIPRLTLEEKRQEVIGKANVNKNRCLPWASATPCIVCEEMCPTPQKSIRLEEATVLNGEDQPVTVQRPHVLRELCIGCGICENHCPLEGEAAILVASQPRTRPTSPGGGRGSSRGSG